MIFDVSMTNGVEEYLRDFKNICKNFVAFKSQFHTKTKFVNSFITLNKDRKKKFPLTMVTKPPYLS